MPAGQIASVTHYEREQLQRHIVAAFGAAAAAVTQNSPLSQRHGSLNDLWESSIVTSIEENKEGGGDFSRLNSTRGELRGSGGPSRISPLLTKHLPSADALLLASPCE